MDNVTQGDSSPKANRVPYSPVSTSPVGGAVVGSPPPEFPCGDRIPHNDLIEQWQQERRDQLGAELAIHVRNYAGIYGADFAQEFVAQGFAAAARERELIASILELEGTP